MNTQELMDMCQECVAKEQPLIMKIKRSWRGQDRVRFAGRKGGPLGYVHDIEGDWLIVEFKAFEMLTWLGDKIGS